MDININPNESIYLDMYRWGLRQIPLYDIETECRIACKTIRQKDYENYWRGYYKSAKRDPKNLLKFKNAFGSSSSPEEKLANELKFFELNPCRLGEGVEQRWVPCNAANKPMVKWSKQMYMKDEAAAWPGVVYLAENLYRSKYIVIDCDGDHNENLDLETIFFLYQFSYMTDCREKPKQIQEYPGYELSRSTLPASFHLTFRTDKIIPTIHATWCHIDILGNQNNQLRYLKNKVWNGKEPALLTHEIWDMIRNYALRKRREEAYEHEPAPVVEHDGCEE